MPQHRVGIWQAGTVPREGDEQFLGIVRAIAKEVASEQGRGGTDITTESLFGEAYVLCVVELRRFDPSLNSSFAHWCFQTVKRSMIRDITRQRRKDVGLKTNGHDRPLRKHHREVIGGEQVSRLGYGGHDGGIGLEDLPDWWGKLTPRQRSITRLFADGLKPARIARYIGLDSSTGPMTVQLELQAVRNLLVDMGVAKTPGIEEDQDDALDRSMETRKVERDTAGGWWERRIGGGTCTMRAAG